VIASDIMLHHSSIHAIASGFYFHGLAPSSLLADSLALDILGKQLLAAQSYGAGSRPSRSAMRRSPPWLHGLESRVQPSLPLVEDREEEDDRGLQFVRNYAQAATRRSPVRLRIPHVPSSASSGPLSSSSVTAVPRTCSAAGARGALPIRRPGTALI
jgi:hypothetical protein